MTDALSSVFPEDTLVVTMLEVLAFPLDTNDVVNSLETMKRKIKELERYANIEIREFLKVGIVIRQAEEGPMRTDLIMNSHRLTTFQNIKTQVTNVKQAQSAVVAKTGDAMDVVRSRRGRPKVLRSVRERARTRRSCAGTARRRASELLGGKKQKGLDKGQPKRPNKGDSEGKGNKKEFKGKCFKCGKMGHMSKDCRSKEASAFEAREEGLAETGCIDMASIHLSALEIGAVQLLEGDRKIRIGIDLGSTRVRQ